MINTSLLEQLFESDVMIKSYLSLLIRDTPQIIENLKLSVSQCDFDNTATLAHNLKSQFQYIKEDDLVKIASHIEKMCDERKHLNIQQLNIHIDIIESNFKLIKMHIDHYLEL